MTSDEGSPIVPPGEPTIEPDRHLTYLIAKVQHCLALGLERALQPSGLTLTQFNALAQIHARPGLSSADLARALLISPQAVGTLIRRLVAADLIVYDQRPRGFTGALRLTDRGAERLSVAAVIATQAEQVSLRRLSEREQATVFDYLSRLLDD